MNPAMEDRFGHLISYLRVSITDRCNERCQYCMPHEEQDWLPRSEVLSYEEILRVLRVGAGMGISKVRITGGEPMIARGIHELAAGLKAEGHHITIETAGTVPPAGIACDLASLSPKLSNSTPESGEIEPSWIERHDHTRLQPEVLRQWIENGGYQLKFVYTAHTDLEEIDALIASIGIPIPPSKILLMPEGTSDVRIAERQMELVQVCTKRGNRYCDRLHIRLFGNKKGT